MEKPIQDPRIEKFSVRDMLLICLKIISFLKRASEARASSAYRPKPLSSLRYSERDLAGGRHQINFIVSGRER
jgi:hypothetical protein